MDEVGYTHWRVQVASRGAAMSVRVTCWNTNIGRIETLEDIDLVGAPSFSRREIAPVDDYFLLDFASSEFWECTLADSDMPVRLASANIADIECTTTGPLECRFAPKRESQIEFEPAS